MKFPTKKDLIPIRAEKLVDFKNEAKGWFVSELTVGPTDDPIVKLEDVDRTKSPKSQEELEASRVVPKMRLVHWNNCQRQVVDFHHAGVYGRWAQPRADGTYVLAGYGHPFVDGAFILDSSGNVIDTFEIGFDVEGLQIAPGGDTWVCYGDEGVYRDTKYGNLIVGRFDKAGKQVWPKQFDIRFAPWCKHLNVVSDNCVWFCNLEGQLHKVEQGEVTWSSPEIDLEWSMFAIARQRVVWVPYYTVLPPFSMANHEYLISTDLNGQDYQFHLPVDEAGNVLQRTHYATRGSKVFFVAGYDVYVVDFAKIF